MIYNIVNTNRKKMTFFLQIVTKYLKELKTLDFESSFKFICFPFQEGGKLCI